MDVANRGLLLVWTDVAAQFEAQFNAWYDRDHVRERVRGIPGVLRGRRFVAYRGGPKYLAAYDMQSAAVMVSAPYLALRSARDPESLRLIPQFRNTLKLVGSVSAGDERAEGCVCALLTPTAAAEQRAALRAIMRDSVVAQLGASSGVVAVRFAESDAGIVARTRGLNPRTGDRFLDALLMIEATSAEALSAALERTDFAALESRGVRMSAPATLLGFRCGLHCLGDAG